MLSERAAGTSAHCSLFDGTSSCLLPRLATENAVPVTGDEKWFGASIAK